MATNTDGDGVAVNDMQQRTVCEQLQAFPLECAYFTLVLVPSFLVSCPLSCFIWLLDVVVDLLEIFVTTWKAMTDILDDRFKKTPEMVQKVSSTISQILAVIISLFE